MCFSRHNTAILYTDVIISIVVVNGAMQCVVLLLHFVWTMKLSIYTLLHYQCLYNTYTVCEYPRIERGFFAVEPDAHIECVECVLNVDSFELFIFRSPVDSVRLVLCASFHSMFCRFGSYLLVLFLIKCSFRLWLF